MASARTLARLDALAWALIYGRLLALVLGIASHEARRTIENLKTLTSRRPAA